MKSYKRQYYGIKKDIIVHSNGFKIKISNSVLRVIAKYVQRKGESVESGGILIGKENISNNNLIINKLTVPQPKDKQSINNFYRQDPGHILFFDNIYRKSNGIYRYIGEWHTHYEAVPCYSELDCASWMNICDISENDVSYYHMIIGYKSIRIWKILNGKVELLKTIQWESL